MSNVSINKFKVNYSVSYLKFLNFFTFLSLPYFFLIPFTVLPIILFSLPPSPHFPQNMEVKSVTTQVLPKNCASFSRASCRFFQIFTEITLCVSAMKQTSETQTHTHTTHSVSQFQVILQLLTNGYTATLN
jgi:hypothetical protein